MKKITVFAAICLLLLLPCSCKKDTPVIVPTETPTQATEAPTEPPTEVPTETPTEAPTEPPTEPPTEKPTQAPTEPPTQAPTQPTPPTIPDPPKPYGGEVIGTSEKGFEIRVCDGITYVGGVMIANKSYSLPASYCPGDLTAETAAAFAAMQQDAATHGIALYNVSGFRSYEVQQSVYNNYCASDGKELADTYSARPGHSEHQTGLALDVNSIYIVFAQTPEGIWLAEHCHEYGFIIRYPEDKVDITGYMYEPWHIRFVGRELAEKIHQSGLCLEEYLGIDSEYKE